MLGLHKRNDRLNQPAKWDSASTQERRLRLSYRSSPATRRVAPEEKAYSKSHQSGLHLYLPCLFLGLSVIRMGMKGNYIFLVAGGVLIWILHPWAAAFNVLRIHSDRFCLLAFAALSNVRNSSVVARMRSISALAFPLGSLGRPTGFGLGWLGIVSVLLHYGGSNG